MGNTLFPLVILQYKILHMNRHPKNTAGFTLVEMVVVIIVIATIAAVSMPKLLPIIAFSQIEGTARHLANYGRTIISESALTHEDYTLRFDLDTQQYYAVRWIIPKEEGDGSEGEEVDYMSMIADHSPEEIADMLAVSDEDQQKDSEFDQDMANVQINDRFDRFARRATEARAKNVKHNDDGILSDIGPLFGPEDEFNLDESNEPIEEEIMDPLLRRTGLAIPEVWIESISIDEETFTSGIVEVEITPLGLDQEVIFIVVNDNDEVFEVIWNPFSGFIEWHEGTGGY
jgi:prepilin-type N-terminal cleavage/methylation domain-containing protein